MKHWTEKELEYLDDSWGRVSIPTIAAHLGRSVNAVKCKAYKTNHRRHIHSGSFITVSELAKALNYHYGIVCNWEKYGLPIKRRKSIKQYYKIIYIEDFWEWAKTHKQLLDFKRIEPLILGNEPKWVSEARRASVAGAVNKKPWTKIEDDRLINMLNKFKYSLDEIAFELNRSEGAVKRRIYDLKLKQRPVKRINRKWTENQIHKLTDMVERGYSFEQIGKELGRTACAVRGKYESLANPGYTNSFRNGKSDRVFKGVSWRNKEK